MSSYCPLVVHDCKTGWRKEADAPDKSSRLVLNHLLKHRDNCFGEWTFRVRVHKDPPLSKWAGLSQDGSR